MNQPTYTTNPNTGVLFRTKEKKKEKSPDMWGRIVADKYYLMSLIEESEGDTVTIKINGWTAESKSGEKYLSLMIDTWKPQEQRTSAPAPREPISDDEIPF